MTRHPKVSKDEVYLGVLAMKFRGTRDDIGRRAIAAEYAKSVRRLIRSGRWNEMPAPEDQLPDEHMPEEFLEFWSRCR
jgi:hypothetical protein